MCLIFVKLEWKGYTRTNVCTLETDECITVRARSNYTLAILLDSSNEIRFS